MKTPAPTLALLLALTGVLAAGCAPTGTMEDGSTGGTPSRPCFYADQVVNFQNGPTGTVYVRGLRSQVFELSAAGSCRDIDNANVIGLEAWGGGSNRLCAGDWAVAHLPETRQIGGPCRVQVVRALTAAEVEALDPRYRP
ncbi:hypothetical protein ASG17_14155 [Brevundimonas sp. Leaf363]|uniref:DUF6491 family protein n=1 Tax=Brevundimonas sp. Leaf363 TaxID=1736353 RepID=UPI0006F38D56|nr:DUF6491 family protein [Brevundimonas sp. Leaf363]KQS53662.1 hypothetical protein ASG17_14155 [Brevundimonas sp. Leaf363]